MDALSTAVEDKLAAKMELRMAMSKIEQLMGVLGNQIKMMMGSGEDIAAAFVDADVDGSGELDRDEVRLFARPL
eukprot:COSAG01_NODE_2050_length_8556_cov_63.294312_1_plen_74_part_00